MPQPMTLRWSAHEHEHVERGPEWFWALGVAAAALALMSILLHDILFGFVIILAAGVFGLLAKNPPGIMHFELSNRGVRVNGTMHKYEEILSFWVEDHDVARPLLLVDTTKFMAPNLIIPIEEIDPHLVRAFLRERCVETPMREPLSHKLLESLGL